MTIIDRYLIWQFSRVFVVTFVSLLGVYIMADSVGNFDEFVDLARQSGDGWRPFLNYYLARVPLFFELTGRIVTVLAVVFTVAWLRRNNEMTALMAAGVSRWRLAKPLVLVGLLISVLAVFNRELGVPAVRAQLCNSAKELASGRIERLTPRWDNQTNILIHAESIIPRDKILIKPRFMLLSSWSKIGRTITAEKAEFHDAQPDRPSGYWLRQVDGSEFLADVPSYFLGEHPVILSPRDVDWLAADECFVVSQLRLERLRRGREWEQYSSTGQLVRGLHNPSVEYGPDVRVLVHTRFIQPFLDMALLFLGLPFVVADQRSNVFVAAGKTMLVVSLFSVAVMTSQAMGIHCILSPAFAAWAPLITLGPLAFLMAGPLQS